MLILPYACIRQRLKTQVPELKEVSWFNGQYLPNDDGEFMFDEPAVYIEFLECNTIGMLGNKVQQVEYNIRLHIATLLLEERDQIKPVGNNNPLVLNHYDILQKVHKALLGFKGKLSNLPGATIEPNSAEDQILFNYLERKAVQPIHNVFDLCVTTATYRGVGYDISALIIYDKVAANLLLVPE
jgi:hypothetical protein